MKLASKVLRIFESEGMLPIDLIKVQKVCKMLATVLKSNIDKLGQASPFFSLLIDESKDVSDHENLLVYVNLLHEIKPEYFIIK